MKHLKTLITCLFLLTFFGCEDDSDPSTITVERYVELLKQGKYEPWELPNFSSQDIPALLVYRNEAQLIKDFPINMISSSLTVECSLGMYILWTIESVRTRAVNSNMIGTFPSQNPVVENRADLEWIEQSDAVLATVAQSYFDWWENNKNKDFDEFKEIDPLTNTGFRWH